MPGAAPAATMSTMSKTCPKCSYARKPEDAAAEGHCPQCGIVYAKFRPAPTLQPMLEPVRASGPRPTSFPLMALLAGAAFVLTLGYFVRERVHAKPEPVLQAHKMSTLIKRDTGQGIPAYTVAHEGERAVARLLPDARKNLAQFANAPVVLFSTAWCSYCAEARGLLDAAGVGYKDLDVERDADALRYHGRVLRAAGVPVIIIGDRVLLGYDETLLKLASRDLAKK